MIRRLVRSLDSTVLVSKLETANGFVARSKGLLGRKSLPSESGLWIKQCNSIHTFFMRFAIDVVFVDRELKVVSIYKDLKPWRMTRLNFKASSVFELPAGTLTGGRDLTIGEKLEVENA